MYRLLFFLVLPALAKAYYYMAVFGDVLKDKEFFISYPWIIDNLSGDIQVHYYLLGSGAYSVPQMCVLEQLRGNAFLQADYLKCEAQGIRSETCLCNSGVDPQIYKDCVLQGGHKAIEASFQYHRLNINASPVIDMHVEPPFHSLSEAGYLKAICSVYLDEHKPRGCLEPSGTGNGTYSERLIPINFQC